MPGSAGGDGTVRLWDTMAVGTYGKLKKVLSRSTPIKKGAGSESFVPGLRAESMVEQNGAALASYHGHALSSPVWSVAMAPSGYYFASSAGDSTASKIMVHGSSYTGTDIYGAFKRQC